MNELVQRLKAVEDGVRDLIKERDMLHGRLLKSEGLAGTRHQEIEVLSQRVAGLERENEVLRTARSLDAAEPEEAGRRIDELVDEIDRCLTLIKT